jgi:Tol biopolymer transport system component
LAFVFLQEREDFLVHRHRAADGFGRLIFMKRCPECRRDYADETLNFCLDDGAALVEGPGSGDAARTAVLTVHETEAPTRTFGSPTRTDRATAPVRRGTRRNVVIAAAAIAIAAAGFAFYRYGFQAKPSVEHFKNIKLDRITAEGGVESATISPDGKYIAYSLEESGKRSLWTKHLGSESRVQIVPPTESLSMYASAFSPDGGYVYYTRQDDQNPKGALFVVPVLGGASRKIVSDVSQPVSVSRDGKQIVFGRYKMTNTDDHLMVVNSDGTNERLLATVREPDYLEGSAATWSPDGTAIAIGYGSVVPEAAGPSPVYKMNVAVISLSDPKFKPITKENWANVGSVAWLSDGSGLVFVAGEGRTGARQIWHCSYPSGETRRVTNDLNSYDSLSLTADDKAVLSIQKHPASQIWVVPDGDPSRARPIVTRKNVQDAGSGIGWTPDGRIVYDSDANANSSIWSIGADGTDPKQLTDGNTDDFAPEVSPDGRQIIFGAVRNGFQVWRMDIDGANQQQITHGTGTPTFSFSPDGKWIVSNPYLGGIFKTPSGGGDPVPVISEGPLVYPQVSPDGNLMVYLVSNKESKRPQIVVVKFDGGEQVTTFDLSVSAGTNYSGSLSYRGFHWSPDGKAIVYVDTIGGVSNLWRKPLDGGPAKQITDFKTDRIYTFAYAHDGKTLALGRGSDTPDAVLITDVR